MKKKSPRAISLELLNRVDQKNAHLDRILSDSFKRYRHLSPVDRAFLTELTYGVLRWRERLDWIIRQLAKIPFEKIEKEILNILRLGLYQIEFLSRTPVSAAVNESVELAKSFRGEGGASFVNGILRSFLRRKEEILYPDIEKEPARHLSVVQSHPLWLVERWIEEMGLEETTRTCSANNRVSQMTLRTNTLRVNKEELIQRLREKGLNPAPTLYSEEGIVLREAPPVSELPFLKEGFYLLQDEASQLVTSILDPKPGERVLDACGAPGGKTTHIGQRMENRGEIYALDLTRERLSLIEENAFRLGIGIVKTVKADATISLPLPKGIKFDRVLADVPCSGFGTLRKNPDLKWKRTPEDIRRLSVLQAAILSNLSDLVKPGGVLVYSTCTVFHEENEDVVERFLAEHPEFQLDRMNEVLPEKCVPLINDEYFKTFPQREDMDGFYAARMIRAGTT